MDPNANLAEQERLTLELHSLKGYGPSKPRYIEAWEQRSDLRAAMREWLNAGGFAPDWSIAPITRKYYGR